MRKVIGDWIVWFSSGSLVAGGITTIFTDEFWPTGFAILMAGIGTYGL